MEFVHISVPFVFTAFYRSLTLSLSLSLYLFIFFIPPLTLSVLNILHIDLSFSMYIHIYQSFILSLSFRYKAKLVSIYLSLYPYIDILIYPYLSL